MTDTRAAKAKFASMMSVGARYLSNQRVIELSTPLEDLNAAEYMWVGSNIGGGNMSLYLMAAMAKVGVQQRI